MYDKKLPAMYDKLTLDERRLVRREYEAQQDFKCWYCHGDLGFPPPERILKYEIHLKWFPKGFLDNPIHLQHDHKVDIHRRRGSVASGDTSDNL